MGLIVPSQFADCCCQKAQAGLRSFEPLRGIHPCGQRNAVSPYLVDFKVGQTSVERQGRSATATLDFGKGFCCWLKLLNTCFTKTGMPSSTGLVPGGCVVEEL